MEHGQEVNNKSLSEPKLATLESTLASSEPQKWRAPPLPEPSQHVLWHLLEPLRPHVISMEFRTDKWGRVSAKWSKDSMTLPLNDLYLNDSTLCFFWEGRPRHASMPTIMADSKIGTVGLMKVVVGWLSLHQVSLGASSSWEVFSFWVELFSSWCRKTKKVSVKQNQNQSP